MKVRCRPLLILSLVGVGAASAATSAARAQDRRSVAEPNFPPTCATLHAPLRSTDHGPDIGQTAAEQDVEAAAETAALADALSRCAPGQAVELALGRHSSHDAFLINPVTLPQGVSLVVDGGVTVFASRNPENFQDANTPAITCGTVGPYPVNQGCKPLLTLAASSGVYGYGVLDGQGNGTLTGGVNAGKVSWWDLLTQKKDGCTQSGSLASEEGCEEASPLMISTGNVKGSPNSDLTLYKITVRNPPFHTVDLGGSGVTVWGVKVQAPWNVPNTDGFDVHGTDITIRDTAVANGDQEIAVTSNSALTTNITVDRFRGYGKGGIALLGDGVGISNVLVQSADITGDLPSVEGTTVNGVPEDVLKKYGLSSYGQALPNATNDLNALQINTNLNAASQSKPGSAFTAITFESICIQDIVKPIHVGPVVPFAPFKDPAELPRVSGVTFRDVHVLAPTPQFPKLVKGIPTPGVSGSYSVTFEAYPGGDNALSFLNHFTLDNVVFDDFASGETSLSSITAVGNVITTRTNVYPPILNEFDVPYAPSPEPQDGLTFGDNRYLAKTPVSLPALTHACPSGRWPFTTGELYVSAGASTNLASASVAAGNAVTLNAVVQPIMSQTTHFMPDSYGADPGLLAVGSPALTNPVVFYEGSDAAGFRAVGSGTLTANGTLATFVVENLRPGTHTYTALYPADRFYDALRFGSVTVHAR